MTVYVDDLWTWPGSNCRPGTPIWCSLAVGSDDLIEELHDFAAVIGLDIDGFQNNHGYPHYDLTPLMREEAINAGAVQLRCTELIRACRRDPLLQ
jgi:hypothetical protein